MSKSLIGTGYLPQEMVGGGGGGAGHRRGARKARPGRAAWGMFRMLPQISLGVTAAAGKAEGALVLRT